MATFLSGFLLSRTALESKSDCDMYKKAGITLFEESGQCVEARYDKLVLLIVDALRFDFVMDEGGNEHYLDNLPILSQLSYPASDGVANGRLFRFRADPPTTTLQRLKALTTGTLPTFIDAGSNFASSIIAEDNLIDKFVLQFKKRLVFSGDDTWQGLFPQALAAGNRTWPYPSFNVWDLDTVDNGVIRHLFPTLKGEEGEWDLFIGHFLGVDHVGHRFGPSHPAMQTKLSQMNHVIEQVAALMPKDGLLVILGDHGMDPKGDHGGDSDREMDAALFLYSPKGITQYKDDGLLHHLLKQLDTKQLDGNLHGRNQWMLQTNANTSWINAKKSYRTIPQIDLIPTLALLFGIPIPVENIGTVIPEMFWWGPEPLKTLTEATRVNAMHMLDYLYEYANHSRDLSKNQVEEMARLFHTAETEWSSHDETKMSTAYLDYVTFTRTVLFTLRRMWARFDMYLMLLGVLFAMTILLLATFLVSCRYGNGKVLSDGHVRNMITGAGLTFAFVRPLTMILKTFGVDTGFGLSHSVIFGLPFGSLLGFLFNRGKVSPRLTIPSMLEFISFVMPIIHASTLFSDNFVFREDSFVFALLVVYLALLGALQSHQVSIVPRIVIIFFLTTASAYVTICREEQMPYCTPTFYATPSSSISGMGGMIIMTLCFIFIPWCLDVLVSKFETKNGTKALRGVSRVLLTWMIPLLLVINTAYWWMDWMIESRRTNIAMEDLKRGLIKYLFVPTFFASLFNVLFWGSSEELTVSEVSEALEVLGAGKSRLEVSGYTTTVAITQLTTFGVVFAGLVLFQKPMGAAALSALFVSCLLLMDVRQINQHVPWWMFSLMHLLSLHYFFRTGHQAVLATLDWSVAFIGLKEVNFVLSPLMVTSNFVASFVLIGFAAVVLSVWIKWPSSDKFTEEYLGEFWERVVQDVMGMMMVGYIPTAFTMLGAMILRRHLMIWRVFAPRFILACIASLSVDIGLFVGMFVLVLALEGTSLLHGRRSAAVSVESSVESNGIETLLPRE